MTPQPALEQPESRAGHKGRDFAAAVALANICYLRVWSELLTYRRLDTYLMKEAPGPAELSAAAANVLLLVLVLFGLATLARATVQESRRKWFSIGFLLFLAIPANAIRTVLAEYLPLLKSPLFDVLGTKGV